MDSRLSERPEGQMGRRTTMLVRAFSMGAIAVLLATSSGAASGCAEGGAGLQSALHVDHDGSPLGDQAKAADVVTGED
jgi:hypothetical protein